MQEWMIAMLVISILLMIRDMAKTILSHRKQKEELYPMRDAHPQKEKVQQYAASFQKLADTFYGMPYRKDYLSNGQIEEIQNICMEQICEKCYQRELCYRERMQDIKQRTELFIRSLEKNDIEKNSQLRSEWIGNCGKAVQFLDMTAQLFQKEKNNLIWGNRMIESRLAVAQQLTEISRIMQKVAEDLYDIEPANAMLRERLEKKLKKHRVLVRQVLMIEKAEGRKQIFLNVRARSGQCISVSEVTNIVSEICECSMIPAEGSRCVLNNEYHMIQFVEDVSYQMIYGVSRLTREEETISGDNYICRQEDAGKFVMCLSDGMGSGVDACKESEVVVELLEQFLESGFTQETAAKMVNSALVLKGREGMFSTIDICAIDLYTGICNFLKAGAATSFIKRDHWVEAITSESLAVGLMQQLDFDTASRKLYHGDYLIMMTDGVLDALPLEREEETMKEIIMDIKDETPGDISRGILERVLGYSDYRAKDDMTVLVAGVWKK